MFTICDCITAKKNNCTANGAHTREHEDHIHNVCGAHRKQENPTFINCDTARKVPNPENLATKQETLPLADTDRQAHVAKLRERINTERTYNPDQEVKVQRVMVTGHTKLNNEKLIEEILSRILSGHVNTYGEGNVIAVSGGALGADKLWARAAYKLGVPFEVYVPTGYEHVFIALQRYNNKPQDERVRDQEGFRKMLELASAVFDENGDPRPENGKYVRGANFVRNTTMIRVSQHHVAVSNIDPLEAVRKTLQGGTYHAIREMKRMGVKTIEWVPAQTTIKQSKLITINKEVK